MVVFILLIKLDNKWQIDRFTVLSVKCPKYACYNLPKSKEGLFKLLVLFNMLVKQRKQRQANVWHFFGNDS